MVSTITKTNDSESILEFNASNVTGTSEVRMDVPSRTPAAEVARLLASRMGLPEGIPYQLRSDALAEFLTDDQAIGDQIAPGASISVVPKSHLGAGPEPEGETVPR